jgi:uncharacterized protein
MLITLKDLEREPLRYDTAFAPGTIDFSEEIEQQGSLAAEGLAEILQEHRGGKDIVDDIRVRGTCSGHFHVACARCLDPVDHPLDVTYDVLFRPIGVDNEVREHSIGASETEIGYYQEGSLLLEDVLREQVMLSVPARTLCCEDCKGLCPRCGANRNTDPCSCEEAPADPRWSALGELRGRTKTR